MAAIKPSRRAGRGPTDIGSEDGNSDKKITQAIPNKKRQRNLPTGEHDIDGVKVLTSRKQKRPRLSSLHPNFVSANNGGVPNAGLEVPKSVRRGRSSDSQEELQAIYEAATRPQTRGSKTLNPGASDHSQKINSDIRIAATARSHSTGHPSQTETEIQAVYEEATKPRHKSKKTGQTKTKIDLTGPEPVSLPIVSKSTRKHKSGKSRSRVEKVQSSPQRRGRSSLNEAEVAAIYEEAVWGKHRSGEVEQPVEPVAKTSSYQSSEQHAWGRHSDTVLGVETATSSLAKGGKKEPDKLDSQQTNVRSQTSTIGAVKRTSKPKKHHQPLSSSHQTAIETTQTITKGEKARKSSKNDGKPKVAHIGKTKVQEIGPQKSHLEDSEKAKSEKEETQPYQRLTAVTRRVSRQTIDSKWEPLPTGGIDKISQLLHDMQRPVVIHLNEERRRAQVTTALQMVSRRLVKKISKIPFPQGTRSHREDDFDFEKILDYNRALESLLTPALHANELLEAELKKETGLLGAERSALEELTANAKTEASLRNEAGRKLHSLLQSEGPSVEKDDLDNIGLLNEHGIVLTALNVSIHY